MTCTEPKQAYFPIDPSKGTKLLFSSSHPNAGEPVIVPCRGCMSCKVQRAQGRAFLLYAEVDSMIKQGKPCCCVTLTYDSDNVPDDYNLTRGVDSHVSKFIRDIRDYHSYKVKVNGKWVKKYGVDFKYFNAGEYGTKRGRPHHHIILFGYDFPDKKFKYRKGKNKYYNSDLLNSFWTYGTADIGDVHVGTCRYVAQYVLKKEFGKNASKFYRDNGIVCSDTGECYDRVPEYCTMSKGIGLQFYKEYKTTIYPSDYVVLSGSDFKFRVPETFDKWLEKDDPVMYERVKEERKRKALAFDRKLSVDDLKAIDKVLRARLALYSKRTIE